MIKHPRCCRPGQRYLGVYSNLETAWNKSDNPFFICWCLDYMLEFRLEPQLDEPGLSDFFMRSWRMEIYRDFLRYELQIWKWLFPICDRLMKNRLICLYLYWITNGFAEDRANGYWWPGTANKIKNLRRWTFLEVDKTINSEI